MRALVAILAASAVTGLAAPARADRPLQSVSTLNCGGGPFDPIGGDAYPCGIPCAMVGLQSSLVGGGQVAVATVDSAIYPLTVTGLTATPMYWIDCSVQVGSPTVGQGAEVAHVSGSNIGLAVAEGVVTFPLAPTGGAYVCTTWSWASGSGFGQWQLDADGDSGNGVQCPEAAAGD